MNSLREITIVDKLHWQHARLSWGAVIAGCVTALSLHLLLAMLGLGLGVRMINPFTSENPGLEFTAVVGLSWTVAALISLWVGGWVAGRTCGHGYGNIGGLHGAVVWAVATVVSALFISASGTLLAGSAISLVTKTAGGLASNPSIANSVSAPSLSSIPQTLNSFLDEATTEDATAHPEGYNAMLAKREIGTAIYRNYTDSSPENHAALIQAVAQYTGRSPEQAARTVAAWDRYIDRLKEEAKIAADKARKALVKIGTWTFLAFSVGAFAAGWGGYCGARRARNFYVVADNDTAADVLRESVTESNA